MTIEEAKQVLLRVTGCAEECRTECHGKICSECEYSWTYEEKILAIKVALGCIGMVQEVIGYTNENT